MKHITYPLLIQIATSNTILALVLAFALIQPDHRDITIGFGR